VRLVSDTPFPYTRGRVLVDPAACGCTSTNGTFGGVTIVRDD